MGIVFDYMWNTQSFLLLNWHNGDDTTQSIIELPMMDEKTVWNM